MLSHTNAHGPLPARIRPALQTACRGASVAAYMPAPDRRPTQGEHEGITTEPYLFALVLVPKALEMLHLRRRAHPQPCSEGRKQLVKATCLEHLPQQF